MQTMLICEIFTGYRLGEADVEGGWGVGGGGANINGELLVENMKKLSLISLRIMYDHFSVNKSDLHNQQVDEKLLLSCKGVTDEILLVKKEKKDLLDCIASLDINITDSFEGEKKKDLLKRIYKKLKLKRTY